MKAPVGKSGPLMWAISSCTVMAGFSTRAIRPLITSVRLCGGILVAMPTAMPSEPLTRMLGMRDGRTEGSSRELS